MESTTVNETAPATAETPNQKIVKQGYVLEQEHFSRGDSKGFSFWSKSYDSWEAMVGHLAEIKRCTVEDAAKIGIGLINTQISSAMRAKATSKLPMAEDGNKDATKALREKTIAAGETLLVTPTEAESYVPGTREKTSIPALWKELSELKALCIEAKKEGRLEDYESFKAEAIELNAKIQELMAAQELANL